MKHPVWLRKAAWLVLLCGMPQVQADDLLQIYQKAQQQDPVLQAARASLQAAEEKIPQARANWLPNVSISSNTGKQTANVSFNAQTPVDREVRTWANTLQLSQPIYRPTNWSSSTQANAQVRQAQAQWAQTQQEFILRTAQAYLDVLVAMDAAQLAQAQLKASEQKLEQVQKSQIEGAAAITDKQEAQARLDIAVAQDMAAAQELEAKWAELGRITGDVPKTLSALKPNITLPQPQPLDLQAWLASAREQHPLVQVSLAAQEVAEKEVDKAQAGHLPSLDLTASNGKNFSSGTVTSETDVSTRMSSRQIGLQLTIPLFAGGSVTSRAREAIANVTKAQAEVENARRQASTLARQAFSGVLSGRAQVHAMKSAVLSSTGLVDSMQTAYELGGKAKWDVFNAKQQLCSAQRDLTKAYADTLMHGLRLKASTGTLALEDVQALNTLLQGSEVPASASVLQPTVPPAAKIEVAPVALTPVAPKPDEPSEAGAAPESIAPSESEPEER